MRLSDRWVHCHPQPTKDKMEIVLVEVDNVAQYYFQQTDCLDVDWQRYYPNIAPPWEHALYVYRAPKMIRGKHGLERCSYWADEYAVLIDALDLEDPRIQEEWASYLSENFEERIRGAFRWLNFAWLFSDQDERNAMIGMVIPVGDDGRYVQPHPERRFAFVAGAGPWAKEEYFHLMSDAVRIYIEPVMLAVSLSHCKNTVVEDRIPPPLLAKRNLRRYGIPMNVHKVLDIKPIAKVLADVGGERVGLRQRLNICRGHFKDYRQRGLFGIQSGVFWWGQHIRGSSQVGVVKKDYRVSCPLEPPR